LLIDITAISYRSSFSSRGCALGPTEIMKRSHSLQELTGKVHLTQYDCVFSINPVLARRTHEAPGYGFQESATIAGPAMCEVLA